MSRRIKKGDCSRNCKGQCMPSTGSRGATSIDEYFDEALAKCINSTNVNTVFKEMDGINWKCPAVRRSFQKVLRAGFVKYAETGEFVSVLISSLSAANEDFIPIKESYFDDLKEKYTKHLTERTDQRTLKKMLTLYCDMFPYYLVNELVDETFVTEFVMLLIALRNPGRVSRMSRLHDLTRLIGNLPIAFPLRTRREWIPIFLDQFQKFFEKEVANFEPMDHLEIDDHQFFYDGIVKGFKRVLEIGDVPTEQDGKDIHKIRSDTLTGWYSISLKKEKEVLKEKEEQYAKDTEKQKGLIDQKMEKEKKLEGMKPGRGRDDAEKKVKKWRKEINRIENDRKKLEYEINEIRSWSKEMKKDMRFISIHRTFENCFPGMRSDFVEDDGAGPSTSGS